MTPRLAALLAVFALARLSAAEPVSLTLEQALATVEKVSLNVLLGRESAAQALEAANQARSANLPVINASAQQRRSQGVSIATVVVTSGRPANRFDALLSGNYSLYDARLRAAADAARAGSDAAQATYAATVQAVLTDVATAYFTNLRNRRRLEVLDANIKRANGLLELARNQLAAGVATQIDITRAEAQLALAEQARLQQVTTLVSGDLVLKRLIDVEPARDLQLEDFEVRRANPALYTFSEEKGSFERRAEYLAAQRTLEQNRLSVKSADYQRLPSLSLNGNMGLAAPRFDDGNKQEQWAFGVVLSVPVFDGLRTGADRRLALSRQRAQEARVHALELQISSELRLAVQDAASRNAQVAVAEKTFGLAQEELRLARQRYQQGVADNREVLESQTRLAEASDNLVDAVYRYNLSRVELARARGDVRSVLSERAK
jgi:outer membrane protein TolC